jgi:hypothetical protein
MDMMELRINTYKITQFYLLNFPTRFCKLSIKYINAITRFLP